MGRSPCCSKEGLNRGAWTALEDKILADYIKTHGEGKWRNIPKRAGLKRCGKSCRLRWLNYLRPDIKRGNITPDEEELIVRLHKLLGNRWSLIAGRLPGRTDNEIKNYWNTILGKKVQDRPQNRRPSSKSAKRDEQKVETVSPSPPEIVQTKVAKCSKVVVIHGLDTHTHEPQHCNSTVVEARPSVNDETPTDDDKHKMESTEYNSSSAGENNSPNFMMDFDMGEFCLSDLLGSEISDFCDKFNDSNDITNNLSSATNHSMFSEAMLQDWNMQDSIQEFLSPNLSPFPLFLDSRDNF